MTGRNGLRSLDLAVFFTRAWQLRFAAVVVALTTLGVVGASSITDSLQLSPQQRADAALGSADARIQLPGTAPLGADGRDLDQKLREAVTEGGGLEPSVDYVASGLQLDGGDETSIVLEEIQEPASAAARLTLESGEWGDRVGEAVVSTELAGQWPVGTTATFFNGALEVQIVGTFEDRFNTDYRTFVVPAGTWSSLRNLDPDTAARLAVAAGRVVRWSGTPDPAPMLTAVNSVIGADPVAGPAVAVSGGLGVETRDGLEAWRPSTNIPLLVATIAGPAIAGLLGGLLAGGFTTRIRRVMWTIGVSYRQTRAAAIASVLAATSLAAVVGTGAGIAIGYFARPALAGIATQELGPITSTLPALGSIPLAVLGGLAGILLLRPKAERPRDATEQVRRWDRMLWRFSLVAVLVSLGIFIGTGTSDLAKMSLAALAIALAILVAFVPAVTKALGMISPHSFATRLALRKLSSEGRSATITVSAVAGLQVLGCALAILVTSSVTQINNMTESSVPPGQIIFEGRLESQQATDDARAELEERLDLNRPIEMFTAGVGSERQDGATRILATVADLEAIIDTKLTPEQRDLVETGGSLLTKPLDGATLAFPPDGDFPGVTLPAARIEGLDPSFLNIDGFVLAATAEEAGMPIINPTYVYTHVTPEQQADAKAVASELNLNPGWVRVYQAPDVLNAPLRVSAITVLLSLIAGLVLLLSATSQARAMRPELSGLRAVGVSPRFIARTIITRTGVTFLLASAFALVASSIGVASAFSLAQLTLGITIPLLPVTAMLVTLAAFTALAAALATRRLRNTEWIP